MYVYYLAKLSQLVQWRETVDFVVAQLCITDHDNIWLASVGVDLCLSLKLAIVLRIWSGVWAPSLCKGRLTWSRFMLDEASYGNAGLSRLRW